MKKLILLLASMAVVVSCSKPNNGTTIDPTPGPAGRPWINKNSVKMVANADTAHLIIGNYEGVIDLENDVTTSDPKITVYLGAEDNDKGESYLVLIGNTAGDVTINFALADTTIKCQCKFEIQIPDKFYTTPLLPFGKTIDEVKALEKNTFKGEEVSSGYLYLKYAVNEPNKYATNGEEIHYVFKVIDGGYAPCQQSTIYAYYGTEMGEEKAYCAWAYTTERHIYGGENKNNQSVAISMDESYVTIYQSGKLNDNVNWAYFGHYLPNTEQGAPEKTVRAVQTAPVMLPSALNPMLRAIVRK